MTHLIKLTVSLAMLLIMLAVTLHLLTGLRQPPGQGGPPTVEQFRSLAELAVTELHVRDVHAEHLEGYLGSTSVVLIIRGRARLGSDLQQAQVLEIDHDKRHLVVELTRPTVLEAVLDHELTEVYAVDRRGVWRLLPTAAGEAALVEQALRTAQRRVRQSAEQPERLQQATRQAEQVVSQLTESIGWRIEVRWRDAAAHE